jgi:ABC-type nitrate/sulfonate/bicarbonate transport system permease component
MASFRLLFLAVFSTVALAFAPTSVQVPRRSTILCHAKDSSRRTFLGTSAAAAAAVVVVGAALGGTPQQAQAVGPVKLTLKNPVYSAKPCPPEKPIPGEK